MDLGNTIKKARKKNGLKQIEFADMCGITQTYLSQIENNVKEPNISTLKRLSEKLSIPLPILFFLSLDDEDVQLEKRENFKLLAPSVNSMLSEFFAVLR